MYIGLHHSVIYQGLHDMSDFSESALNAVEHLLLISVFQLSLAKGFFYKFKTTTPVFL